MATREVFDYLINSSAWAFVGYQLAILKERVKRMRGREDDDADQT